MPTNNEDIIAVTPNLVEFVWSYNKLDIDVHECMFPSIQQFKRSCCLVPGRGNPDEVLQPKSRAQSRQSHDCSLGAVSRGNPGKVQGTAQAKSWA